MGSATKQDLFLPNLYIAADQRHDELLSAANRMPPKNALCPIFARRAG